MTEIGDVIQPGRPIPDDVTEVKGTHGPGLPVFPGDHAVQQLTVTAVREQPAEPGSCDCESCDCKGECCGIGNCTCTPEVEARLTAAMAEPVAERKHCGNNAYVHKPHEWLGMDDAGDKAVKRWCRGTGPVAESEDDVPTFHVDEIFPPEPQQADVSVLDLVQQHGDARWSEGTELDGGGANWGAARAKAAGLLNRIAALLPQQPVQARTRSGDLIWQHTPCGWPNPWHPDAQPQDDCQECQKSGPWRPLLVGGDPAPEVGEGDDWLTNPTERREWLAAERDGARASLAEVFRDLGTAQKVCEQALRERDKARAEFGRVNAEAERVTSNLIKTRDELADARAEVERLLEINRSKQGRIQELQATQARAYTDEDRRFAAARAYCLAVYNYSPGAHISPEAREQHIDSDARSTMQEAGFNALYDALTAQPDPLVLRLPDVPLGTVALVGMESGERRESPGLGPNGLPYWCGKDGLVWQLGAVLDMEPGGVRVEMAPPRRTWPQLDVISHDLEAVQGASGKIYHRSHFSQSVPVFRECDEDGALIGMGHMFYALQTFDGPLTEVFDDEPGGTASPEVQR